MLGAAADNEEVSIAAAASIADTATLTMSPIQDRKKSQGSVPSARFKWMDSKRRSLPVLDLNKLGKSPRTPRTDSEEDTESARSPSSSSASNSGRESPLTGGRGRAKSPMFSPERSTPSPPLLISSPKNKSRELAPLARAPPPPIQGPGPRGSPFDRWPLRVELKPEMPHPSIENNEKAVSAILRRLANGPKRTDGHGFVCIYQVECDPGGDLYRRIVSRMGPYAPAKRESELILAYCRKARRCNHAAVLIRRYLDAFRVHRYQINSKDAPSQMLSVNKNKGTMVHDLVLISMQGGGTPTLLGKPVQKDWFVTNDNVAKLVVDEVVRAVNEHWTDEKWASEDLAMMK